jgi:hypothetical protein
MKRLLTKRFFARLAGLLVGLVALGAIALGVYKFILLPQIDRWGATEAEIAAAYPGD